MPGSARGAGFQSFEDPTIRRNSAAGSPGQAPDPLVPGRPGRRRQVNQQTIAARTQLSPLIAIAVVLFGGGWPRRRAQAPACSRAFLAAAPVLSRSRRNRRAPAQINLAMQSLGIEKLASSKLTRRVPPGTRRFWNAKSSGTRSVRRLDGKRSSGRRGRARAAERRQPDPPPARARLMAIAVFVWRLAADVLVGLDPTIHENTDGSIQSLDFM